MKYLLLVLTLFFFTETLLSQNYIPFPVSNASWLSVEKYAEPQNKKGSYCFEHEITIGGDSILQGVRYTILNQTYVLRNAINSFGTATCANVIKDSTSFLGLLKDDTIQQKVYLRVDSIEYLMYDFSAQVGDTIKLYKFSFKNFLQRQTTNNYVIDSIDTVLIAGKLRRVFKIVQPLTIFTYSKFIEGIGSTGGLFRFDIGNTSQSGTNGYSSDLKCFNEQSIGSYSPNGYPCPLVTGVGSQKKSKVTLKVFPNPTNQEITLQSNQEIVSIQLLSFEGKLISDSYVRKDIYKLNIPEQSGMYIVKVTYQDGTLEMRKILKQ